MADQTPPRLRPDQTMPPDVVDAYRATAVRLSRDPAFREVLRAAQRAHVRRIRPLLPVPADPAIQGPYLEGHAGPVWRLQRPHTLYLIATVQADPAGRDWYHVSYSQIGSDDPPCHDCTEAVRYAMFRADALVLALYPPKAEYVSHTPGVLHLWQRLGDDRLVPDLRLHTPMGSTL